MLVGVVFAGCTANRAYRDQDARPWHSPAKPFVAGKQLPQYEPVQAHRDGSPHPYELSYVEFDEKGDFWDRRQLAWTVQGIQRAARAQNVVLVVYVHGWQNDASDLRGHDVAKFHCLLERLAEAEGPSRHFYGVYLGWRGKSVPGGDGWFPDGSAADVAAKGVFFLPHELSFFGRKAAAAQAAGMPMTETIFETVRAARTGAREGGRLTKSILIGHSFGALVVEKAMAQALAAEVITSDGTPDGGFAAPADFIVLLNSAGDAIYAKEMTDLLRRRHPSLGERPGDEVTARRPLMVAVTSTADWATGKLFPIGTTLGNVGGRFRRYEWDTRYGSSSTGVDQREYFATTAGHNAHLISHEAVPDGPPSPPTLSDAGPCAPDMLGAVRSNLQEPLTGPNGEVRFVTLAKDGTRTGWTLRPRFPYALQTPYWIVQVPREIMRDHSDIFNENSLALLARLFRLSNPAQTPGIAMTAQPRRMRLAAPGTDVDRP